MISILCPSRGRPEEFKRMTRSAFRFARGKRIQVICYLDADDPELERYPKHNWRIRYVVGPRILLSETWNACFEKAGSDVAMHCGDDVIFRTEGWDELVLAAFEEHGPYSFVYGHDLGPHGLTFGTHGFLHRSWVETLGYFLPPFFSCDWADVWLNEVADRIERKVFVPIVTEHLHPNFGKAEIDQTHKERMQRGIDDDVVTLYKEMWHLRELDAQKLTQAAA